MATTPKGLFHPDPSTPMSLEAIVQQAQESVDDIIIARVAMGVESVTTTTATLSAAHPITFPLGRFTVAPFVVAMADGFGDGRAQVAARSSTGCNLYMRFPTSTSATVDVQWVAFQMLHNAAAG